jgi:hypothetical protein
MLASICHSLRHRIVGAVSRFLSLLLDNAIVGFDAELFRTMSKYTSKQKQNKSTNLATNWAQETFDSTVEHHYCLNKNTKRESE